MNKLSIDQETTIKTRLNWFWRLSYLSHTHFSWSTEIKNKKIKNKKKTEKNEKHYLRMQNKCLIVYLKKIIFSFPDSSDFFMINVQEDPRNNK